MARIRGKKVFKIVWTVLIVFVALSTIMSLVAAGLF